MKIRPMGAEFSHPERRTDGQTDRHDQANITSGIVLQLVIKYDLMGCTKFRTI